jgi:hypothetical protein
MSLPIDSAQARTPPWTVEHMFYNVIAQCTQALQNLETLLDKAEQDAASKKYDVGVLITSRLAPGQHPFIQQVQIACDYVKFAAARLSGQIPPHTRGHGADDRRIASPDPQDSGIRAKRARGAVRRGERAQGQRHLGAG